MRCSWQEKDVVAPEVAIRKLRVSFTLVSAESFPMKKMFCLATSTEAAYLCFKDVSYLPLSTLKVLCTHFRQTYGGSE